MSDKRKGGWTRGKPKSEEAKIKMSLAHRGKKISPEAREKMANAKRGKPRPQHVIDKIQETKRRQGEAQRLAKAAQQDEHMVSIKDIKKEHLEFAIDYIHKNGKKVPNTGVTALHSRNADNMKYCLIHENHKEILYPPAEVVRVAFLYALEKSGKLRQQCEDKEYPLDFSWNDTSKHLRLWDDLGGNSALAQLICDNLGYTIQTLRETQNDMLDAPNNKVDKHLSLLLQFRQVIFYGPPGTGKTYQAKAILKNMLNMESDREFAESQGDQWDIVQFHPSYNYEDFVRGVQVSTNDEGQIKYETKNRIFAEMCDKALPRLSNVYALIIDEINRANVSSVLGELIYALEYRNKSVSTPYEVDGSRLLTIPPNLFIIGTMNTADRTIGALDYAVRRRFAFVHCPPDESLIEDAEAKSMFGKVKYIFTEFLSPDFDAADVEIGHSYFMAEGERLRDKIQYQVIPILEEYVKDGVLLPEAKEKIKELLQEKRESEPPQPRPPRGQFRWTRDGRSGTNGVGRTVLSIVQDFVENDKPQNITELQQAFPDHLAVGNYHTVALEGAPNVMNHQNRYFINDPIDLPSGERIVVCTEWGAGGPHRHRWDNFTSYVQNELGYTITEVE